MASGFAINEAHLAVFSLGRFCSDCRGTKDIGIDKPAYLIRAVFCWLEIANFTLTV